MTEDLTLASRLAAPRQTVAEAAPRRDLRVEAIQHEWPMRLRRPGAKGGGASRRPSTYLARKLPFIEVECGSQM